MRKSLSVLTVSILSLSLLTACGQNTAQQGEGAMNNAKSMVNDTANAARSAVNSVTDAVIPDSNPNNAANTGNSTNAINSANAGSSANSVNSSNANNSANTNKGGQTPLKANPDTKNFIGEERAKQIALDKAGLKTNDVIFDRVKLENDDGVWVYEVEFKSQTSEFDAEIKADNGKVLEWEEDKN